jgi:hypothetical protein
VCAGDTVHIGPLNIRVLEGRHFRNARKGGIDAVGYVVSAENAPTIAFPSDVRDYRLTDGDEVGADHCFAHLWLTDHALEPEIYIPKSREFASFMLQKSRKSIFLTHLYIHRSDEKRWTAKHARVACEAIKELSPDTQSSLYLYRRMIHLGIAAEFFDQPWLNTKSYSIARQEYTGTDLLVQNIFRATYEHLNQNSGYLTILSRTESNRAKKNEQ